MIIRKARIADIPALTELERECFSVPWSQTSFEAFFRVGTTKAFVAEEDGEIVAYIGMYRAGEDGEITNVAVTKAHRRKGIAEALIKALEQEGLESLRLEVRESNEPARRLYEKLGFKEDGIRKNFYSHPKENAVLMSKSNPNKREQS